MKLWALAGLLLTGCISVPVERGLMTPTVCDLEEPPYLMAADADQSVVDWFETLGRLRDNAGC